MIFLVERITSLIACIVLIGFVAHCLYCLVMCFKYGAELNKLSIDNDSRRHYPERYEEVNKLLDYHTNN